jgi:hypothetical protein
MSKKEIPLMSTILIVDRSQFKTTRWKELGKKIGYWKRHRDIDRRSGAADDGLVNNRIAELVLQREGLR